jgi:hypothetical protein
VQDVRVRQKKVWNEWYDLFFSVWRNLCAMRVLNWKCRLWPWRTKCLCHRYIRAYLICRAGLLRLWRPSHQTCWSKCGKN